MTLQTNALVSGGRLYRMTGVFGLFLIGAALLAACTQAPTTLTQADEIAIYAAVVRQIYVKDDTFGGNLQPPTLYVRNLTSDGITVPEEIKSDPKLLPEAVRAGIEQALADLPTRIVWVDDIEDVPRDAATQAVAERGAFVTVGNVYLQKDGSAHVSSSILIAPLAAGGQTYVIERVDGAWQVTGTTGPVWMAVDSTTTPPGAKRASTSATASASSASTSRQTSNQDSVVIEVL